MSLRRFCSFLIGFVSCLGLFILFYLPSESSGPPSSLWEGEFQVGGSSYPTLQVKGNYHYINYHYKRQDAAAQGLIMPRQSAQPTEASSTSILRTS